MTGNIVKYGGLALVIIGVLLVARNLFTSDSNWKKNTKNKEEYYNVEVRLLEEDTDTFIAGASLVIKDIDGEIISGWTTEDGAYTVTDLKEGLYTLEEEVAPSGYSLNEDGVAFEVKDEDSVVTMYNTKLSLEELRQIEEENRIKNTTTSDVLVDNTSSKKSIFIVMSGIISILVGGYFILLSKKNICD